MAKGDCVLAKNRRLVTVRGIVSFLMAAILTVGMVGCGGARLETPQLSNTENTAKTKVAGQLSEVAPPPVLQQLSQSLEAYQPQVTILSPNADEILQDTKVSVQFQVQDLPIFKDPDLALGPHLHVILDNQPYQAVYDISQPLVLEDLSPGTHTLRVFASRPWDESFKNEGAYAQTTFHIFTKTTDNNPDPAQPLLTYNNPQGSYGTEPILLDFYLTNAPLHLVAQENPDDEIADWRIRATVNGESFILDRWQSIYLKGFKPGKNWVKLEFLDEQGNPLKNVFNDTVRLITYDPKSKDTLSKLVRGEISAVAARGIVEQNYKLEPTPTSSPAVEETPTTEEETPLEIPEAQTTQTEAKQTEVPASQTPSEELPVVVPKKSEPKTELEKPVTPEVKASTPTTETVTEPEKPVIPEVKASTPTTETAPEEATKKNKLQLPNFFKRFQRSSDTTSEQAPVVAPSKSEPTAEPEKPVNPEVEASTPTTETATEEAKQKDKPTFANFWKRFQRPAKVEETSPQASEEVKVPSSEPIVIPQQAEIKSEPEKATIPSKLPIVVEEPKPVIKPVPTEPLPSEKLQEEALKADESAETIKVAPESGEKQKLELQSILEAPSSTVIPESVTEKLPAVSDAETSQKADPQSAQIITKPDVPLATESTTIPESVTEKLPAVSDAETSQKADPQPAQIITKPDVSVATEATP
jgi:hypothetical protein